MALWGPGPQASTSPETQRPGQEDDPVVSFPSELRITLVTEVTNGEVLGV